VALTSRPSATDAELDEQLRVVMDTARLMNSIIDRSTRDLDPQVTTMQFRVLVMLSMQGSLNLSGIAKGLGVHPSNATRVCARLAELGLLDRRSRPTDRRNVEMSLTTRGRRMVSTVMRRRRAAARRILVTMPVASRQALAGSLHEFTEAAAEMSPSYALVLEGHGLT
jgi:DNA-binding MarR family transcriptional regulator